MKTMTHTPAQRKAWHAGKKRPDEDKYTWWSRNFKQRNFRAAFTPRQLKRCIIYAARD